MISKFYLHGTEGLAIVLLIKLASGLGVTELHEHHKFIGSGVSGKRKL